MLEIIEALGLSEDLIKALGSIGTGLWIIYQLLRARRALREKPQNTNGSMRIYPAQNGHGETPTVDRLSKVETQVDRLAFAFESQVVHEKEITASLREADRALHERIDAHQEVAQSQFMAIANDVGEVKGKITGVQEQLTTVISLVMELSRTN